MMLIIQVWPKGDNRQRAFLSRSFLSLSMYQAMRPVGAPGPSGAPALLTISVPEMRAPRQGLDEVRFSIRGSGLRNNDHGRGVNFLINGIPSMDADGFSDFEAPDFLAAQRVEVWKGANPLRHGGNTSGGAINLVTSFFNPAPGRRASQGGLRIDSPMRSSDGGPTSNPFSSEDDPDNDRRSDQGIDTVDV
jgi:outer membrane receptor protein involved in Fe transport